MSAPEELPTAPLAASAGDRCPTCDERLASDQRYCVNCGERRGKARFPVTGVAASRAESAPAPPPAPRRPSAPAGATLITGVATLLLAMGVGVLIGRSGTNSSHQAAAPSVQVVGGPAGTATTPTTTASASSGKKAKTPKSFKKTKIDKKTAAKAQAAASKVIGGKNLPPPTVKVGQHGHGPGFKGGKFTGDFFGK